MTRRLLRLGMLLGAMFVMAGCSRSNAPAAASAPSPVATATAAAQNVALPEGVLYQDDFSNPESGWPIVDVDNYRFGYHPPDFYHVELKALHDSVAVFRGMNFSDASVETTALVDHTTTETGDYRYGLALRRSGGQYYAFTVSPRTKTWQITKHSSTGVKVLGEGAIDTLQGFAPKGVTPDKKDDLRVDAVGANFAFFINGRDVAHVSDADYATGDIGFFVETLDESLVHVHYDSLVIRTPQAAPTSQITPTIVAATLTPTATPLPATLPSDPDVLIDTVLNDVVEQANNVEVDAILSGDENNIERWWDGAARDHILSSIKSIRDRFVQMTSVSWTRSGEWIKVLSHSDTTATYATSETWTFVGTVDQHCADGSQMSRRYVETYPNQRYTLELRDGAYHIVEWQLGRSVTGDISTLCP